MGFVDKTYKLIDDWIKSFDNNPNSGLSARKLSAFFAVCVAGYVTIHYCNPEILTGVLHAWLAFALLCLSVITLEQIVKLKNGNGATTVTEREKTTSESEVTVTTQPKSDTAQPL